MATAPRIAPPFRGVDASGRRPLGTAPARAPAFLGRRPQFPLNAKNLGSGGTAVPLWRPVWGEAVMRPAYPPGGPMPQ